MQFWAIFFVNIILQWNASLLKTQNKIKASRCVSFEIRAIVTKYARPT